MIRVTIEMVPGGFENLARKMATIEIRNDLTETLSTKLKRGSYIAKFSRISQQGKYVGWYDRQIKTSSISRNESGAVYRILYQALKEFFRE